jgi:hypothetical protein
VICNWASDFKVGEKKQIAKKEKEKKRSMPKRSTKVNTHSIAR